MNFVVESQMILSVMELSYAGSLVVTQVVRIERRGIVNLKFKVRSSL